MSRYWENQGQPLPDGRLCLVIDPEDGTHPLRTYGMTVEEVLDKASRTIEHGQRLIGELRSQPQNGPRSENGNGNGRRQPPSPPAGPPAPRRAPLTADEQMAFTADLSNPARSPEAVRRLVEHAAGVDLKQLGLNETVKRVSDLQMAWQRTHPDFPDHPVNVKLINDSAALRVGYANITAEVMEQVYQELLSAGMLIPVQESAPADDHESTPTLRPDETPVSRTVRPRGATSVRRSDLRSAIPAVNSTAKYTRAQIDAMSGDELGEKIRTEPGFRELLDSFAQARPPA